MAERIGPVEPLPPEDPKSALAAFTVPGQADAVSADIDKDLKEPGVNDMTAKYGTAAGEEGTLRLSAADRHPLRFAGAADREEGIHVPVRDGGRVPAGEDARDDRADAGLLGDHRGREVPASLIDATHIDRLNIGPMPTIKLNWLQPHEGSIVDFLFRARAFQFEGPVNV